MRVRALDTETYLIGPNSVFPRLVCVSAAERINGVIVTDLWGNGDADIVDQLRALLAVDGNMIVGHAISYDLVVIATMYPDLEPMIWAKLEAGEIVDTMLRERLLNLSRHGKLDTLYMPDGSTKQIRYQLMDLVMTYLGIDLKATKTGDDIWRLRYCELDGMKASQYPKDAADYAQDDAKYTLMCYEQQDLVSDGSMVTDAFQTAADFALACITQEGMPIDPVKFNEVSEMLARELSSDNLAPLIASGIITPPEPVRVYANQLKKAIGLVAQWTGDTAPTSAMLLDWRQELEASGVKFKPEEPSHLKTERLQHRVLACYVARETDMDIDDLFRMPFADVVALAEERGVKYNKTPGGDISTASDVVEDVAGSDEVMQVFAARQELQKLVTTELPRMTWEGQPAKRVHFRFNCLVETGRTSSRAEKLYPSANGQNIDPRARPILIPPPGYVLCSTDYATLELVCVAQTMLNKFGYSVHAEKINAGYDLHAYLGSVLATTLDPGFRGEVEGLSRDDAYQFFMAKKKDDPKFYKKWRGLAKPIGLGFPGGLGSYKMLSLAKNTYGVDIVEEAIKRFNDHPVDFDRSSYTVCYHAKRLYGMEPEDLSWTPTLKGIALSKFLRDIWLDTYPEMVDYFDGLQKNRVQRTHGDWLNSEEHLSGAVAASDDHEYTTPFGMVRKGCSYTSAANGEAMQSPAAEGFKAAIFNLQRGCRDKTYGSKLYGNARFPNEIHDETLTFLREEMAHELAMEVKDVMEKSMQLVIQNVKVKAEPCLMRRWYKQAEPVYKDGRLVPWEPPQ